MGTRDGTVYENRPNRSVRLSRFDSRVLRSVHALLLFLIGESQPPAVNNEKKRRGVAGFSRS